MKNKTLHPALSIPLYNTVSDFLLANGINHPTDPDFSIDTLENYFSGRVLKSGPFQRNYFVFVYVCDGEGKLGLDNTVHLLGPNTFYYAIPLHISSITINKALKGYLASVSDTFIRQSYRGDLYTVFPFLAYQAPIPVLVKLPLQECFSKYLTTIHETFKCEKGQYRSQIISNLLVAFLYKVKQLMLTSPDCKTFNSSPLVRKFLVMLDENFREMVAGKEPRMAKVADFADRLHVSPNYLGSRVSKETGKPITRWIKRMVLSEAEALLMNTDLSIQQISDKLQFDEPTNFTKFFKKETGRTPKDFRIQAGLNKEN